MHVALDRVCVAIAAFGLASAASGGLPSHNLPHKLSAMASQLAQKVVFIRSNEVDGASAVLTGVNSEFEMYFTALHNVRACSPEPRYGRIEFSNCPALKLFTLTNAKMMERTGAFLVSSPLKNDLAAIVRIEDRELRPLRYKMEAQVAKALMPPGTWPRGNYYCASFATNGLPDTPRGGIAANAFDREFISLRDQIVKEQGELGALLPPGQGQMPPARVVLELPLLTHGAFLEPQTYKILALADAASQQGMSLPTSDVLYTPIDEHLWLVVSHASKLHLTGAHVETNCEGLDGSNGGGVFGDNGDLIGITSAGSQFQNPLQRLPATGMIQHTRLMRDHTWVPLPLTQLMRR